MLLMTWMLLVTGRSKPSDGRLARVGPLALRAWISSALGGCGVRLTTPSRMIHSRPPSACWIDSQPGVMVVDRVTGSPGSKVPSVDDAGTVARTVPGWIGQ